MMDDNEILRDLIEAVRKADINHVMNLCSQYREMKRPIKNFRYLEGIFWLRSGDVNKARMALHAEIAEFPANAQAAKIFLLIQPASRSLSKNPEMAGLYQSIDYIYDHPDA